mmetsp:Transcript_11726/g.25345  ORF Transcript_11726/g.25345 Transcript_11726/m.25345 type:complete len:287 (-) Transcript_11726:340-1200(-)
MPIESPRSHQRLVQTLREVGGADHDNAFAWRESVELDEQLVQRHFHVLLVFWVARAADRVDLVDKHDARRVLLRGREQLAHPARAHPNKHLLKLTPARVEKRYVCLSRNRARQHRLPRARRPHKQQALRQLSAQARKRAWRFQVLHDLFQLRFRLVAAFHVLKHRGAAVLAHHLRLHVRVDPKAFPEPALLHNRAHAGEHQKRRAQRAHRLPQLRSQRWLRQTHVHRLLHRPNFISTDCCGIHCGRRRRRRSVGCCGVREHALHRARRRRRSEMLISCCCVRGTRC